MSCILYILGRVDGAAIYIHQKTANLPEHHYELNFTAVQLEKIGHHDFIPCRYYLSDHSAFALCLSTECLCLILSVLQCWACVPALDMLQVRCICVYWGTPGVSQRSKVKVKFCTELTCRRLQQSRGAGMGLLMLCVNCTLMKACYFCYWHSVSILLCAPWFPVISSADDTLNDQSSATSQDTNENGKNVSNLGKKIWLQQQEQQ